MFLMIQDCTIVLLLQENIIISILKNRDTLMQCAIKYPVRNLSESISAFFIFH